MYSLDLAVDNMNLVENMIYAGHRFHVENSRDIFALDDMLLNLNALNSWHDARQESHYRLPARQLWHPKPLKGDVFGKGHLGHILAHKAI